MKKIILYLALNLFSVAYAHHSTANFDNSKEVPITGIATLFSFSNPHSFIDVDVTNSKGEVEKYKVFATSKVVLVRYGWRAKSIQPGDMISIVGNPDRGDAKFIYLRKIVFADGKTWLRSAIDN